LTCDHEHLACPRRTGQALAYFDFEAGVPAATRAALAAGCRWLVAETGAEPPGGHNSSLHNLLRLGFQLQYVQPNWIWRPTG
jgi:hypothetical protein